MSAFEWAVVLAVAGGYAVAITTAAGGGFIFGCAVYGYLAKEFKTNANLAVQRAYNDAKQQFMKEMKDGQDKAVRIARSELPKNADEATQSFEEGLANLYPNDETLKKALREQRAAGRVIPPD